MGSFTGRQLLASLKRDNKGILPLIAGLGVVTPDVEHLRDRFNLYGMKVLQFAFDGNSQNPYLPENIIGKRWAVYTGTHDNPTTLGWWKSAGPGMQHQIAQRINGEITARVASTRYGFCNIGRLCDCTIAGFDAPG